MFLRVYDDSLVVRLEIATAHLDIALGLGWDADEGVTLAQIEQQIEAIRRYSESHFGVSIAGQSLEAVYRGVDVLSIGLGDFVQLEYHIDDLESIPEVIEVYYSVLFDIDSTHRNLLVVEHNWKTATFNNELVFSLVFSPRNDRQVLDLSKSSWLRGVIGLVWLGVLHIWIGIDHILFLMALVLPSVLVRRSGGWEPVAGFKDGFFNILWIVTFFTIAHSVTLGLAGFGVVRLPSRLVETIIAGSIAVAAAANLLPSLKVKEWVIAFGFGLFHGFGFASVMGDIGIGRDHLIVSVFGFNVGVEIGQMTIIAIVFPSLFLLRKHRLYLPLMRWGSYGLIAIAMVWFGERISGVNVPLTAIVLWLPRAVGGALGLGI
jgi:HupE/UreJ protein